MGVFVQKKENCDGGNLLELMPPDFEDSNEIHILTPLCSTLCCCRMQLIEENFELNLRK